MRHLSVVMVNAEHQRSMRSVQVEVAYTFHVG